MTTEVTELLPKPMVRTAERCSERTARRYRDFYVPRTVDTADDLEEFECEAVRRGALWTK